MLFDWKWPAEGVPACFDNKLLLTALSSIAIALLSICFAPYAFQARTERAVRYTVPAPPQLENDYQWKPEEMNGSDRDVSEVCKDK